MPRWLKILLNTVGVVVALAAALMIARGMMERRAAAPERPQQTLGELVDTLRAELESSAPTLRVQGTVVPGARLSVAAEVGGRVVERHPALEAGGVITAGETLFRVDSRDYRIALREAETALALARTQLELEEGRQRIARSEWERFGDREAPSTLALREPQRQQAELDIERAQQALDRARLQLERTRVSAPFTALVQEAALEVGQLVTPGQTLATLIERDTLRVQASVPTADLDRIAVPGFNAESGSAARVHGAGGAIHEGTVLRLLGEVDPVGRMARVLIALSPPDGEARAHRTGAPAGMSSAQPPPLLGDWVQVELEGHQTWEVVRIPRAALRQGREVYVLNGEGALDIRSVDIAWREEDMVALRGGLAAGERVVLSRIAAPVQGMPLRDSADTARTDTRRDAPADTRADTPADTRADTPERADANTPERSEAAP